METAASTTQNTSGIIDTLNEFLRGEISAVETYAQTMERLANSANYPLLGECLASHQTRVAKLRQRILQMGGMPAEGSGPWGSFAKLIQGGANLFGEKTAIAALEEGEDHGRDDYQRDLTKLDVETRSFVESEVLPEQLRTHATLSTIKQKMRS